MKNAGLIQRCLLGWLALVIAIAAVPPPRAVADAELKNRVDALAQPLVDGGKVVGLAVGVIRGGETHIFSYGRHVQGGEMKITGDTIFEIGSLTQAFTGLLLADMAERGLVRLDQPVQDLLPRTVAVPKHGDRPITLLDLVTNTSGLPKRPDNLDSWNRMNPYAGYSVGQLYEYLSRQSLAAEPGAKLEFSYLGMGLLGHALALRAGMSYEALLKMRIAAPLGLKDTTVTLDEAQQKRFAQGYNARVRPTADRDDPILTGAGAIRSSMNDVLRFIRANIEPAGTRFETALLASQVPRFEKPDMPRAATSWVFVDTGSEDGLARIGGTGGFRNYAVFNPKLKIGVVVLANTASDEIYGLGNQVVKLLFPPTVGIGVGLGWRAEDGGYPTVKDLFAGGPAAKSGGIEVGDRLVGIEDESGVIVDFKVKSAREVLGLIRGARGSSLRVVVEKNDERKVYELIREIIEPAATAATSSKR
jgi:D-alanyl-D-alanine-carboxypeptidase/D-alanyl-D-alanine-endopeptidase